MLVLLSPSKKQDFETPSPVKTHSNATLLEESQTLILLLRKKSAKAIAELMDVSDKIAKLNHERYRTFKTPFTPGNAKPAAFAFKGDVYAGLEVETLDEAALNFAQEHIRILSGLYGVLRPLDLIQPYRLEMKIKLANSRGKDLYAFWDNRITDALNETLTELGAKVVLNLASEEYAKAVKPAQLRATFITPQFKEKKKTGYQMIGLFAKRARGLMARYIAENKITNHEAIAFFAEEGYRLNTALSKRNAPVFTRG